VGLKLEEDTLVLSLEGALHFESLDSTLPFVGGESH